VLEEAQADPNVAALAVEAIVTAVATTGPVDRDSDPPSVQTVFTLRSPLGAVLRPAGATVSANVAPASHGQSKTVVLGSGDASVAGQSFELRAVPIVFLRGRDGVRSTLVVRVNGVRWTERESFFGAPADDRIYVVQIGIDGKTVIAFGDGSRGARLPDGTNNVVASLRVGADPEVGAFSPGNVRAGRLSDLVDRPLGATKVRNPAPAHGGADPSTAEERRVRIPIGLRAFRRAVAPADYADLALEQVGVAKSRVDVLGGPGRRRVVVTVAGVGDVPGEIGPFPKREELVAYLRANGDPLTRVTVVDYLPRPFDLHGTVFVDPARVPAEVLDAVKTALRHEFRAANRRLASPVTASDVVAVVQAVPGVRHVDLDEPVIDSIPPAPRVNAWPGSPAVIASDGSVVGASLVTLRPDTADGSAGGTVGLTAVIATDGQPGALTP
jgi:predicted phage baseplate assembly protein